MSANPVLTIAGVMPGSPEMTHWQTASHGPDIAASRGNSGGGPSLSMAGAMPTAPTASHWQTAFPNGEAVYVDALRAAEARAAIAAHVVELPKPAARRRSRRQLKAA
ncbi:MAG: hypothetical protein AB1673_11950 [Actinomycetota bacterium]